MLHFLSILLLTHMERASSKTQNPWSNLFLWGGILIALILLGSFVLMFLRARLQSKPDSDTTLCVGFSLADLRAMRDRNEISENEFQVARNKLIAKMNSSDVPPKQREPE